MMHTLPSVPLYLVLSRLSPAHTSPSGLCLSYLLRHSHTLPWTPDLVSIHELLVHHRGVNHAECTLPPAAFLLQHPFSKLCKFATFPAADHTGVFQARPSCPSCPRDATTHTSLCLSYSSYCIHPHSSGYK
jgi:hypothetical protein